MDKEKSQLTPNRLIKEKSPYLLQHAYNPVDWYAWGPEAFEKARREDKPILVSIGYSTCHWCHVMERESYEDPEIAKVMNQFLVNIKVDREERPDVDRIYMTAVQALTGSGGWPLNIFLTPELKPFYGGTYYPPIARWGQPGWREVVAHIGEVWTSPEERAKIFSAGENMTQALGRYVAATQPAQEGTPAMLDRAVKALAESYDAAQGGFGRAPKFPMPVYHFFLLRYAQGHSDLKALEMSVQTLKRMAQGGIYDHLGGGFSRYSTDAAWHVPHFEKMLYDNAQLAVNYLEAFQITADPELRRTAEETLAYVRRDMTHTEGGFYSAEDADSLPARDSAEKKEGAFYVWSSAELKSILSDEAIKIVPYHYGVLESGNARHDPHGEFTGKNILFRAHSVADTATKFGLTMEVTETLLADALHKLFVRRASRPRPHLDDKIIAAWNGLMISGFAKGFRILRNPSDLKSAQDAARFLKKYLYDSEGKIMKRSWRDGESRVSGIADDYAFVLQGLLDLFETDFNPEWLEWAVDLATALKERFWDEAHGGFFMTAADQDPHLLFRVKEDSDNVEPAASSVAALSFLRLAHLTGRPDFETIAQRTLAAFGQSMDQTPQTMAQMCASLDTALARSTQLIIVGGSDPAETDRFLQRAWRDFSPYNQTVLLRTPADRDRLARLMPFVADMKTIDHKPTAYLCFNRACQAPTTDWNAFDAQLKAHAGPKERI